MKHCRINVDLWDKYQLDVEVGFEYEPYDPGVRYHPDGSGTPPSGDSIEVIHVRVLWVTNTVTDQTMGRQVFRELGLIAALEANVYDVCYNSEPGEDIYDAIYNSRNEG